MSPERTRQGQDRAPRTPGARCSRCRSRSDCGPRRRSSAHPSARADTPAAGPRGRRQPGNRHRHAEEHRQHAGRVRGDAREEIVEEEVDGRPGDDRRIEAEALERSAPSTARATPRNFVSPRPPASVTSVANQTSTFHACACPITSSQDTTLKPTISSTTSIAVIAGSMCSMAPIQSASARQDEDEQRDLLARHRPHRVAAARRPSAAPRAHLRISGG